MARCKAYAEVAAHGVTVYSGAESSFFRMPVDDYLFLNFQHEIKTSYTLLISNTRQAVTRIADVSPGFLTASLDFLQSVFPVGGRINESTYVFDSCIFENSRGQRRVFITALPVGMSEAMTQIGLGLVPGVKYLMRLDTIEHIIFRRYVAQTRDGETVLLLLPQEGGFRLLYAVDGLPQAVHYISDQPIYRQNELSRVLRSFESDAKIRRVVFLESIYCLDDIKQGYSWLWDCLEEKGLFPEKERVCDIYKELLDD